MESLYSINEAAEYLGLSPKTIYDNIRRGKIPHKRIGSRLYIPIRVLKSLLRPKYQRYKKIPKKYTAQDLLSVTEVGKEIGYTREHVYRLIRKGYIFPEYIGRNFYISKQELERYKKEGNKKLSVRSPIKRRLPHSELVKPKPEAPKGWRYFETKEDLNETLKNEWGAVFQFLDSLQEEVLAEILFNKLVRGSDDIVRAKYAHNEDSAPDIIFDTSKLVLHAEKIANNPDYDMSRRRLLVEIIKELYGETIEIDDDFDCLNQQSDIID